MKTTKFVVKVNRGGTRAPEYMPVPGHGALPVPAMVMILVPALDVLVIQCVPVFWKDAFEPIAIVI